jgi:uncharacterized SAM-binding protein YcdF (DUF218 family)
MWVRFPPGAPRVGSALRTLRFVLAALVTATLVCTFLLTAPAGARLLLWSAERAGGSASVADIATADAIALLGGRTARVHDAARLHLQTRLPLLITGKGTGDSGYRAESEKMAEILRTRYGITPRWLETEAIDTRENAVFSWCLLAPQGIRTLALVTDPDHMLRARAAFHAVGFRTIPAPAPFRKLPALAWSDLLPTRQIQPMATHTLLEWGGAAAMLWEGWSGAQKCASSSARIATKLQTPVRNSSQGPGRES